MAVKRRWWGVGDEVHSKERGRHCSMSANMGLGIVSVHVLSEVEIDQDRMVSPIGIDFYHKVFWIDVSVEDFSFNIHLTVYWGRC